MKAPPQPTRAEIEQHKSTHTPYASWCKHCVAARAIRRDHPTKGSGAAIVPDVGNNIEGPIKVSMDYMYLYERTNKNGESKHNPPHLIVIEHLHGRCWAHQVPNKGVHDKAHWLPRKVVQDLDNKGMKDAKIQLKSDQEPAIINVQTMIQEIRPGMVITTNSLVGESQCNGRVENAFRRAQEKVRALKHQVESGIKCRVLEDAPIMSWMVRWAAELLSKYAPGEDGRTPYERIRHEICAVPIAPFGEMVLYLPFTTVKRNKGDPVKRMGIYLGTNDRTEESMIGTETGATKCRSINRLTLEDRWNRDAVLRMRGATWEPVPGVDGSHVPVNIDENGVIQGDEQNCEKVEIIDDEAMKDIQPRISHDKLHVSRKAIQKYWPTDGCPACGVLVKKGHMMGRIGHHHSDACRSRIMDCMKKDPEYRGLTQKHDQHQSEGDIEVLSIEQLEEMRGRVRKAIHCIQQNIANEQHNLSAQLDNTMLKTLIGKMEMAEVYSPPRVTEMARKMGLKAGWRLDITTYDSDGEPWDFNKIEMRNRASRKILTDEPMVLIGSPMCTAFCAMNNANYLKMSAEEVSQRMAYGRKHLQFCSKLYAMQWKVGRYFLHGHPAGAISWQEKCIQELMTKEGIIRVNGDQCMFGIKSNDGTREGPARKATGFFTNSVGIAEKFNRRCPNRHGDIIHKHVTLESGRTRAAQVYPEDLCRAICEGLQDQIRMDA